MKFPKYPIITAVLFFLLHHPAAGQIAWHMQPVQLQTRWAKNVSSASALKEYPRPQMTRIYWTNLNGLWDYAITKKDSAEPSKFDGQILVPFPIESALSGVKKALQPDQNLWYKRKFSINNSGRTLLHFGAVDWQTTVFVNGKEAAGHTGGYSEFTMDITDMIKTGENELVVKVFDPTDEGIGPHGKQTLHPENIYYTATSGIWQTVWLETVPQQYIQNLTLTPNVDSAYVAVTVHSTTNEAVQFIYNKQTFAGKTNQLIKLPVKDAHLWTPDDPYLYNLTVKTQTDEVKSYFGMRKISVQKDEKGIDRIFLNNQPYYNLGVLDQGFWPDGLYTAPTDEALAFDIKAIKAMGFNTIRKHIKVEPARWYYWADKLGMLVWQDLVNPNQGLPEGAKPEFERESADEITQLHNYPCITTWVLFNEKWGQYDQKRLTDWLKAADPSRIVNGHTGELLYVNEQLRSPSPDAYVDADMTDVHSYPSPMMPVKQAGKPQVVGEFGGIGLAVRDHEWNPYTGWGYIQTTAAQLPGKYEVMVEELELLKDKGLSGSIYTQPYDVEGEENGLMTYDRKIIKIPLEEMRRINSILVPTASNISKMVIENNDKSDETAIYAAQLKSYIDGNRDTAFLKQLALLSLKQNDKLGGMAAAGDYLRTLKAPLSAEQINFVTAFTKSTKDPGYVLISSDEQQFKAVLGDRQLTVDEMNMIYAGEIAPALEGNDKPDWEAIKANTAKFGAPGEEMYLRARTIADLNAQNWTDLKTTGEAYLAKYGDNVRAEEKQAIQNNIDQH